MSASYPNPFIIAKNGFLPLYVQCTCLLTTPLRCTRLPCCISNEYPCLLTNHSIPLPTTALFLDCLLTTPVHAHLSPCTCQYLSYTDQPNCWLCQGPRGPASIIPFPLTFLLYKTSKCYFLQSFCVLFGDDTLFKRICFLLIVILYNISTVFLFVTLFVFFIFVVVSLFFWKRHTFFYFYVHSKA